MSLQPHREARTIRSFSTAHRMATLLCAGALTLATVMGLQGTLRGHIKQFRLIGLTHVGPAATSLQRIIGLAAPAAPSVFERELAMRPSALINRWQPYIAEASERFHISASWIRAVMREESGGRTVLAGDQPITSRAGAVGIMQLMPDTYAEMRQQYALGADPFDPHDNVIAATAYLRWLERKYGFPNMFAAYNDGPGKLDDHLNNGAPLPDETKNYLASIARVLGHEQRTHEFAVTDTEPSSRITATISD
jgi:hypothetical protein